MQEIKRKEKNKGLMGVVMAPHHMVYCHLGFLVSLWIPPTYSKTCHKLTPLP